MKDYTAEACRRSAAEARNVARQARKVSEREMFQRLADCYDILAQQLEETAERSNDGRELTWLLTHPLLIVETLSTEPTGSCTHAEFGPRGSFQPHERMEPHQRQRTPSLRFERRAVSLEETPFGFLPRATGRLPKDKDRAPPRSRGPERTGLRCKGAPPGKGFRRSNY
jgi:hypothetical protein